MPKYQKICKKCSYKGENLDYDNKYIFNNVIMLRLHIRHYYVNTPQEKPIFGKVTKPTSYKAKWIPIGWICPQCEKVILDNPILKKLTIIRRVIKLTPKGKVRAEKKAKRKASSS